MMKRRNRLILITVLVAVLLLALLHGCQSGTTPVSVPEKTEAPVTESTAATTTGAETTEATATELPEISTEATGCTEAIETTESTLATEAPTEAPTEATEAETEPELPNNPKPTESKPTEPKPTEPKPTEPKPTEPAPTEPAPAEPAPTEPSPAAPTPAEPAPTEPTEPPHTHSWSDWTQTKAPSCTAGGEEIRSCSCGATESRATDTLGHDWVHHEAEGHWLEILTCRCGAVFHTYEEWYAHATVSTDLEYLGAHSGFWNTADWIVDVPAYDVCSRCGLTR